jgi:predicted nucleic acid-binding Zn ribbon protein
MPKRPRRDKQSVRPGPAPRTVRDLISARLPALAQRALSAPETSEWHVTVMSALGPDLANKVNGITLNNGRISVIADSSAWASRIRFVLAEVEPALRAATPDFRELVVRVRPRRGT